MVESKTDVMESILAKALGRGRAEDLAVATDLVALAEQDNTVLPAQPVPAPPVRQRKEERRRSGKMSMAYRISPEARQMVERLSEAWGAQRGEVVDVAVRLLYELQQRGEAHPQFATAVRHSLRRVALRDR